MFTSVHSVITSLLANKSILQQVQGVVIPHYLPEYLMSLFFIHFVPAFIIFKSIIAFRLISTS